MESAADEVVAVIVPDHFRGVGEWYRRLFTYNRQEVRQILTQADARARRFSSGSSSSAASAPSPRSPVYQ